MSAAEVLTAEAASPHENPFKFLDYYDEKDRAIFAGRAEELTTVLAELALGSTYVLYGRSGLGKTSIIKAGLFPRLTEVGYLPIYVRILDNPELDLCHAVAHALDMKDGITAEALPKVLANIPSPQRHDLDDALVQPVILVLDQFEEFFIRFRENTALRKHFADLLGAISGAAGAAVHIVFSLREDYVAELNDLRPQLPDTLARSHRLLPLTAIGAREAILATLRAHHVPHDDAVPGLIVKELERHRFSPLVLQVYCSEVFEAAKKENPNDIHLRANHVVAVGSVEDVYKRYLEEVTKGLTSDRALLACCMLDILRTAEETKRVLRVKDVGTDTTSATPFPVYFNITCGEAESLLNELRDKRVVRRLPTEEAWYELLHDGIVPVLSNWLQTTKEFRSFRDADRLVENIHTMEDAYLGSKLLSMAIDPYQRLLRLTPAEISFLFRSSVYEQAPSVAYWAKRFDGIDREGAAEQVIGKAIESPDHVIAGVVAAGRLKSAALAPLCLRNALRAPLPNVRHAAGMAYAQIGAVDFAEIKSALHHANTRRAAIDLLADLQMAEHELGPIGRFTRWRVGGVVTRRKLSPGTDLIRNRTTLGTLAGLTGALLVLGTMVVPVSYVAASILSPDGSPLTTIVGLGLGLLIPLSVLGAWIGRRSTSRAARDAVLHQTERWSKHASTAWELEILTFAVATFAAAEFELPAGLVPGDINHWLVHLLPAVVLIGLLFWSVSRLRRAGWKVTSAEGRVASVRAAIALSGLTIYTLAFVLDTEATAAALLATLLIWTTMPPAIRLLERVVDPATATLAQIAFRVIQMGYLAGVLPLLLLFIVRQHPRTGLAQHVVSDATAILMIATVTVAVRASITAFSLAWAQKAHPLSGEGITLAELRAASPYARSLLTFGFLAIVVIWLIAFGPHSVPFLAEKRETGNPIRFQFSPNLTSTKYVDIVPRGPVGIVYVEPKEASGFSPSMILLDKKGEQFVAITPNQPLRAALTNMVKRENSGPGSVTFRELLPGQATDDGVLIKINALCSSTTSIHLRASGAHLPMPAAIGEELQPFALFLNDNVYEFTGNPDESTSISKKPSPASPAGQFAAKWFPPTISDKTWKFDLDVPVIAGSGACRHQGDRGTAFGLMKYDSKDADQ